MDWAEEEGDLESWEYPDEDELDSDETPCVRCPQCGSDVYEDTPQCPCCGHYLEPSSQTSLSLGWKITALVLLILFGLGVLASLR